MLPAEFRHADSLRAGDVFECERFAPGEYSLRRVEPAANRGVVDWLLSCPEKGYFVPVESESTDTL